MKFPEYRKIIDLWDASWQDFADNLNGHRVQNWQPTVRIIGGWDGYKWRSAVRWPSPRIHKVSRAFQWCGASCWCCWGWLAGWRWRWRRTLGGTLPAWTWILTTSNFLTSTLPPFLVAEMEGGLIISSWAHRDYTYQAVSGHGRKEEVRSSQQSCKETLLPARNPQDQPLLSSRSGLLLSSELL